MLTDPGRYWDRDWNPERLTVRHMDALALEFEDESFDAIFSSSSIEHFGDFPDVRRGVEEMFRVLRPGGVLALATEFRLEGDRIGYPGLLRFDEPELRALLLDGLWWDPATPLDLTISEQTLATAVEMTRRSRTSSPAAAVGAATRTSFSGTSSSSGRASTSPCSSPG